MLLQWLYEQAKETGTVLPIIGSISKFVIYFICFPNNEGWYHNSVCGMPLTKEVFSGSCISLSLLCTLLQAHTSGVIINAAAQTTAAQT